MIRIEGNIDMVYMEIADQGIGIPLHDQKHIFDRFYRAKNADMASGTGLGLNIVQNYVAIMGGAISFESVLNKGTTFYIRLPNYTPTTDGDSVQ